LILSLVHIGHPQELIRQFETYQPGSSSEVKKYFENVNLPNVKMSGMDIVSNRLRAVAADGKLHLKQVEAIYTIAKKFGITDEEVQQVRALVDQAR